jgi:hypothetical protein
MKINISEIKHINPRIQVLQNLEKNSIGAEIGVWKGDFSRRIINIVNPTKLFLIDPWKMSQEKVHENSSFGKNSKNNMDAIYLQVQNKFKEDIASGVVNIVRKKSTIALKDFPDNYFDWIYIDGDHSYKGCLADCLAAYDKVKVGGFICGDDYVFKGWWGDGVIKAFNELVYKKNAIVKFVSGTQIMIMKA